MSEYPVTETVDLPQGFKLEISDTVDAWRHRLCHGQNEGPWESSKNPANITFQPDGATFLYYAKGTSYTKHLPEGKLFYCVELTD